MSLPKLIVILGVTSSGKTDLAIKLAQKFKGEVVSADSRQIYKEFDIGTSKPPGHWMNLGGQRIYLAGGIPHHLVDIIDPKEDFTLADYKSLAVEKINEIVNKGRVPFLVGGTALYLKAVCENWDIPKVKPNLALRSRLERKNAADLFNELQKQDPEAAAVCGPKNKRRIIRALEVILATGRKFSEQRKKGRPLFNTLKIGRPMPADQLKNTVIQRTGGMLKAGLATEVKKLHERYSWSLVPMQSIDYQEFRNYFERQRTLAETLELINKHHLDLARRQMTWFKKDKTINWIQNDTQAVELVQNFLKKPDNPLEV
ncbi:MAG: tRNA (adenosine(37)-N6)-dimethylallyltransferase MiaA [Patescibacteria group bacterium]